MRAYDCPHDDGTVHKITGGDDDELFRNMKAHLAEYHMDLGMSDDEIRETIGSKAYNE